MDFPLNEEPYKFQHGGMEFGWEHHYNLIADEMGLGKTMQALGIAAREGKTTSIVVPTFLIPNWLNEIKKFVPYKSRFPYKVFGYTQLKKYLHILAKSKVVIADEAHYLKNPEAQRTILFTEAIKRFQPKRMILLSGTPIKNRIPEFYSLLKLISMNPKGTSGIDIGKMFRNQWEFNSKFCNQKKFEIKYTQKGVTKYRIVTKWEGSKNVDHLKLLMKNKFIRRLAKNELDLPKIIRKNVMVSCGGDKPLADAWAKYIGDKKAKHISTAKKDAAISKADFTGKYAIDLIEAGEGPLVIFTDHPEAAYRIQKAILAKKYKAAVIDGGTPSGSRQGIADRLGRDLDALVCTIGATSVGFNLVAARNLIFNDMAWVPGDNSQAEKRIHRIGQTRICTVHRIVGSKIDEQIISSLTTKMDTINEIY